MEVTFGEYDESLAYDAVSTSLEFMVFFNSLDISDSAVQAFGSREIKRNFGQVEHLARLFFDMVKGSAIKLSLKEFARAGLPAYSQMNVEWSIIKNPQHTSIISHLWKYKDVAATLLTHNIFDKLIANEEFIVDYPWLNRIIIIALIHQIFANIGSKPSANVDARGPIKDLSKKYESHVVRCMSFLTVRDFIPLTWMC